MSRRPAVELDQWHDWLARCTERLLALDERAKANASADDQRLIAAAFVARKALAARFEEIDATTDGARVEALFAQAVGDDLGRPVGSSVADAAGQIDQALDDVERRLGALEAAALAEAEAAASADADLRVARSLAEELGSEVNATAALADRLARRDRIADVAGQAGALRQRLERLAAERDDALHRLALVEHHLDELRATEERVTELAARCRAKISSPPRLGIPSVDRLGPPPEVDGERPWSAQRASVRTYLDQVGRVEAALAEAQRRLQAPLTERDDLRGLLQAFRDKAAGRGGAEDPAIEPLYRAAADELWQAPCDLAAARQAVQRYVDAVNRRPPTGAGR